MKTARHLRESAPPRWAPLCPACGCAVDRIARRLPDRWLALLFPVRRYRCLAVRCGWQGTLRCD